MVLVGLFAAVNVHAASEPVLLRLYNKSPQYVRLNWVDSGTRDTVFMADLEPDQYFGLDSWQGHEFQVLEQPDKETGVCIVASSCQIAYFKITESKEQCKSKIRRYSISYFFGRVGEGGLKKG